MSGRGCMLPSSMFSFDARQLINQVTNNTLDIGIFPFLILDILHRTGDRRMLQLR